MNEEEIKEALEIIKKPITVNCIEYKYFDEENYNKITNVYENCLWFANNLEQINLTVENLQKENQKLKEQYCERTDCSGRIGNSKKVEQLQTEKEQLNSLVNSCQEEIKRLKSQLQQKEDIINKIEDYLIKNNLFSYQYDEEELCEIVTDDKARTDLLKILDNKGE